MQPSQQHKFQWWKWQLIQVYDSCEINLKIAPVSSFLPRKFSKKPNSDKLEPRSRTVRLHRLPASGLRGIFENPVTNKSAAYMLELIEALTLQEMPTPTLVETYRT